MEADADLAGGYAKIGVASGKILDSVIPTTIARTSAITTAISNVVPDLIKEVTPVEEVQKESKDDVEFLGSENGPCT